MVVAVYLLKTLTYKQLGWLMRARRQKGEPGKDECMSAWKLYCQVGERGDWLASACTHLSEQQQKFCNIFSHLSDIGRVCNILKPKKKIQPENSGPGRVGPGFT